MEFQAVLHSLHPKEVSQALTHQVRSHRVSSSAAQPASKRSKPSADPSGGASGSAVQPAFEGRISLL